ncbi:PFE-CTERM domain-containing protein [Pleurocapsa sp. FMAR1]|uniref:PFE-CTERM domain-containing protein n=1 Tax=Pleurocapsa sp. FMAR1 TaxID=3040204 RepID=UPI0029C78A18|nr:hypothetical protein [Pleurocapsa sp. FMAR1]
MFISIKKFTPIALVASFLSLGNLIAANSANAYSITPVVNNDFESTNTSLDGSNGWTGIGSTEIRGTYSGVSPSNQANPNPPNARQGVITTACPSTAIASGLCNPARNDDPGTTIGTFNLRTQDQITASPELANLQTQLGLSPNAFSIPRKIGNVTYDGTGGKPALYRTPKEGSAIFQNITIGNTGSPTNTLLTYNYDFLTNDGAGSLGNKDFGFVSISAINGNGYKEVIPLEDSTGTIATASGTNFSTNTKPYQSGSLQRTLTPGNYRVGFGVVDVDGSGYSSGLLIDNFNAQAVPFDFSPTAGLGLVAGIFGLSRLRRKFLRENN